ncbi:MAG: PAS domain S-box protein [Mucilaginibacter sp.]
MKRSEAEEEMMAMNEELEERVQARTAELNELLERYRESESKFKTAFEYSAIGMAIVSLKGEWLKVNIRLCEMLSYTENELLSKSFMDITPKDDDYSTLDIVDYVINSQVEVHRIEKRYICGDQSIIWVSVNISVIKDENGKVLYFVNQIIDITARKKAEEELKSSEQKYKLLFDSSPVPLWIVSKNDLSVIAVNEAVTKHYGYSREELLQMTVKKLRPPEGWEKLEESYHQNFSTATNMGVIEHLKKDGTSIWVNIIAQDIVFEGNLVRLTSTNDVTEKLRAEELLKKNEANLQTILNNTDTAYALLGANLEILEYNNKALIIAEKLFNFDPKSNRKLFDTMPDSRRGEFLSHIKKVFEGETISYEVNYPQPGNKDFWYYVRMFPIADKNNKILGLVLAVTDITERKEAEQSLQSAYEQIKINITFIREIIWKQSHVLRSPLANLIGLMTMLRANPADKEVLDHIETEFERMDTVLIEMARDSSADEMNF